MGGRHRGALCELRSSPRYGRGLYANAQYAVRIRATDFHRRREGSHHVNTTDRVRPRGWSGSSPRAAATATALRWVWTSWASGSRSLVTDDGASVFDLLDQPGRRRAEHPYQAFRPGDRDRPVPVVHRRVRLAPGLRSLAHLQCRLVGEADRPAGPEVDEVLEGRPDRPAAAPATATSLSAMADSRSLPRPAQQGQRRRGEPGLHDARLVGEVERQLVVDQPDSGPPATAVEHDLGVGVELASSRRRSPWWSRTGSSPGPCRTAARRHLGSERPVGLAEPGALAELGIRHRHERRCAAADYQHPLTTRAQAAGVGPAATRRHSPGWDRISSAVSVMSRSMRTNVQYCARSRTMTERPVRTRRAPLKTGRAIVAPRAAATVRGRPSGAQLPDLVDGQARGRVGSTMAAAGPAADRRPRRPGRRARRGRCSSG